LKMRDFRADAGFPQGPKRATIHAIRSSPLAGPDFMPTCFVRNPMM
jgi:hypothetical protein